MDEGNRLKVQWVFGILAIMMFATLAVQSPAAGDAICNDGTYSYSSGSGTCSWHGGVDYWVTNRPKQTLTSDSYDAPKKEFYQEDGFQQVMIALGLFGAAAIYFHFDDKDEEKKRKDGSA